MNVDPHLMSLRLALHLFISQFCCLQSLLVLSIRREYWALTGPRSQDEYSSWSLKGNSQWIFQVPKRTLLGPVGSCAQSGPIMVSRKMSFSNWHLAPPLWWDSTLDGQPHQNHKEEERVVHIRKELGADKLRGDHYL